MDLDFASSLQKAFPQTDCPKVIPDGGVHRFHIEGDSAGSKNGWYVLHLLLTGSYGSYGSWKGPTRGWSSPPSSPSSMSQDELKERNDRLDATRERNESAARRAADIVSRSSPAEPDHPYLVRKRIMAHSALQRGDMLLVPIKVNGALTSLQSIDEAGVKRFLPGGKISSGYHLIRGETISNEIAICEGFATGCSLFEHTGATTFCALSSGNLAAVARFVRSKLPKADIIICADNDAWAQVYGNPGVTAATEASAMVSGRVLAPDFSCYDQSAKPTDWNDLAKLAGCLPADLFG
jgi:putative DNA primase/helicase